MPYMIDGHNLIGKIPGLRLDDLDDERELIEMLQSYCQQTGKDAEIYFDRSSSGHARANVHGRVTARFVRSGETADQAISRHLKRLGNAAANWTVISSDHQVQNAAKRARARVIASEDFNRDLVADLAVDDSGDTPKISDDEMDEWLDLFGASGK